MTTRQSVAVHTRWGIPVGQKVPVITLRECISELFSLTKRPFEKYNFLLMFNTNHKYTLIHLTVIRGYSCRTFFFLLSLIGPKLRCSPPPPDTHTHTHISNSGQILSRSNGTMFPSQDWSNRIFFSSFYSNYLNDTT